MKLNTLLAAALTLGCALSSQAASYTVVTDSILNSTGGGVGVDFGLHLTAGELFRVATDPSQIWHGALQGDPYYNFLSTSADGAAGLAWFSPTLNGIGATPVGTLVAEINGDYRKIGAGTTTFTAWGTGEILFHYADIGNQDNFGSVTSTVTTAVPEPTSMALLLAGLGVVGVVARRRKA